MTRYHLKEIKQAIRKEKHKRKRDGLPPLQYLLSIEGKTYLSNRKKNEKSEFLILQKQSPEHHVIEILKKCMEINSADNATEVFFNYAQHVRTLHIRVFENSWKEMEDPDGDFYFKVTDDADDNNKKIRNKCTQYLLKLCDEIYRNKE